MTSKKLSRDTLIDGWAQVFMDNETVGVIQSYKGEFIGEFNEGFTGDDLELIQTFYGDTPDEVMWEMEHEYNDYLAEKALQSEDFDEPPQHGVSFIAIPPASAA